MTAAHSNGALYRFYGLLYGSSAGVILAIVGFSVVVFIITNNPVSFFLSPLGTACFLILETHSKKQEHQ